MRQVGRDLRALGPVRLAAIGPRTADALRGYHLEPDLVPAVGGWAFPRRPTVGRG